MTILLLVVCAYLLMGFFIWLMVYLLGGFTLLDGKTRAPFWPCLIMTILMWPAAINALRIF